MSLFLIIVLSVVLVIDCTVLVFLVLMQLPKKEAGAGLAFGGAATDALFGAGSGNFLTKATKYTAGIFFALAVILSVLQSYRANRPGSEFLQRVKSQENAQPTIAAPPTPTTPATAPNQAPTATQPPAAPASSNLLMVPQVEKPAATSAPGSAAPTATTNGAPAK